MECAVGKSSLSALNRLARHGLAISSQCFGNLCRSTQRYLIWRQGTSSWRRITRLLRALTVKPWMDTEHQTSDMNMGNPFQIIGPFKVDGAKVADKEYQKTFWYERDEEYSQLSEANGLYVFSLRNGSNYEPNYVGMTKREFRIPKACTMAFRFILVLLVVASGVLVYQHGGTAASSSEKMSEARRICTNQYGTEENQSKQLSECSRMCLQYSVRDYAQQCVASCRKKAETFGTCLIKETTPRPS